VPEPSERVPRASERVPRAQPGTQYRTLEIDHVRADPKTRVVEASLSSTEPVPRDFGSEVLDHTPSAIDFSRAKQGLPLLFSHNPTEPIGIVENVRLVGQKLRGLLRFGSSTKAREVFEDVQAGILRNLSIGYSVQDFERQKDGTTLITKWLPMEVSIVSIPADATVGINRAREREQSSEPNARGHKEIRIMSEPQDKNPEDFTPSSTAGSVGKERKRVADILDYGKRMGVEEWADQAVRDGTNFASFREYVLEHTETRRESPPVRMSPDGWSQRQIGLTSREAQDFSIRKLILAAATNDWTTAGFEKEALRATGPGPHGGYILPYEVVTAPMQRDISTSSDSGLVPTLSPSGKLHRLPPR